MHSYFAPPFIVVAGTALLNANGRTLCHASCETDDDGAAPWLHDIAAALNAPTEKSVPVSVILEEAANVCAYIAERVAQCRALDSRALKHSDLWISRSVSRLNSLNYVLATAGHFPESHRIQILSIDLHREWCKVRAATGAVSINWD